MKQLLTIGCYSFEGSQEQITAIMNRLRTELCPSIATGTDCDRVITTSQEFVNGKSTMLHSVALPQHVLTTNAWKVVNITEANPETPPQL